jgi:hypothetical protein
MVYELDLLLVASAGDPFRRRGEVTDDEVLALAGACCEVEQGIREREWAALELVLGCHFDADEIDLPYDPN